MSEAAFAVFRPRRGRYVAYGAAAAIVAVFTLGAVLAPGRSEGGGWHLIDRVVLVAFGVAIAAFLWRYAAIRAIPSRSGIVVHNLLRTRSVEWGEIVGVQFAGGDPWVSLDLADTDALAVMAIQRADGIRSRAEAARLMALVEALGEAPEPEPDGA